MKDALEVVARDAADGLGIEGAARGSTFAAGIAAPCDGAALLPPHDTPAAAPNAKIPDKRSRFKPKPSIVILLGHPCPMRHEQIKCR